MADLWEGIRDVECFLQVVGCIIVSLDLSMMAQRYILNAFSR